MREINGAGLNQDRLQRIESLLERACAAGQFAGASWVIALRGEAAASGAVGSRSADPSEKLSIDTRFDLASLTKPIATATSILFLLDRGELSSADEVRRYFPEAGSQWDGITLRHLLTHTSGLPPYATLYTDHSGVDAIREGILALQMNHPPGVNYDYSCLGYIMLQNVIQKVAAQGLEEFTRKNLYAPLGMKNTGYCPSGDALGSVASGGVCPHRSRMLLGEVHDPLAFAAGGVSGNAGLFSSAIDVGRWGAAVLAAAAGAASDLFGAAAARLMLTNQIDPAIGGQSFGLFTVPNGMLPRGDLLPLTTAGHTGFTGTSVVLSPESQFVAVLLTNSLVHTQDKSDFFRTRRLFHTLVGAAIYG